MCCQELPPHTLRKPFGKNCVIDNDSSRNQVCCFEQIHVSRRLTLSLTNFWPSTLVVTSTWSTMPLSLWRRLLLTSRLVKRCACPGVSSGKGVVLPMITSSPGMVHHESLSLTCQSCCKVHEIQRTKAVKWSFRMTIERGQHHHSAKLHQAGAVTKLHDSS